MNLFEGGVHDAKMMSDNQYTISLINELRRVIFTIIQDFIQTISVQKQGRKYLNIHFDMPV